MRNGTAPGREGKVSEWARVKQESADVIMFTIVMLGFVRLGVIVGIF